MADNGTRTAAGSMPMDPDAEAAVLSAMTADPEVADDVLASGLGTSDFYRPANRTIFEEVAWLRSKGQPCDLVTLKDRLKTTGGLGRVGGEAYLLSIYRNTPLASWERHADILRRLAAQRAVLGCAARLDAIAADPPDTADEVYDQAERCVEEAVDAGGSVTDTMASPEELATQSWTRFSEMGKHPMAGVATGFYDLDALLGGMRPGQLVILAARTSMGKTALAAQMAYNAAEAGTAVVVYELEMGRQELLDRLASAEMSINSEKFMRDERLTSNELQKALRFATRLSKMQLWIDDGPNTTLTRLRTSARRVMRKASADKGLVVVDYLNLMGSENPDFENRQTEVASMARGLKLLAKELGVPVLALTQLNRSVENRAGMKPRLSDLRESGAIEQDADVVMFLDRSRTPEEGKDPDRPDWGSADVIVAKHRNGPLGTAHLMFQEGFARFKNA